MTHIDVGSALQASVRGPYNDLVTRRTGAAVRTLVEQQLSGLADGSVAFLDFSRIGVLDRSCADEFVAKLMLPLTDEHSSRDGYVVFHGVNEIHLEAIEAVLETHNLALVVEFPDSETRLIGAVSECERVLWELVMRSNGGSAVEILASAAGIECDEARSHLESLARRRLVRRQLDSYAPLGGVV